MRATAPKSFEAKHDTATRPEPRNWAAELEALDEALARGITDAEAEHVVPLDEAFRRLRDELGLEADDRRA
ncbi:hypothetical protein [Labrys wisconsinensis]|uniref:DNA-binding helix-hairpin-helix protein with protein kinase domain n=1 Tax=Labrys wisconsinensis TaxID=425677 RepID=A0ABU0J349_9HYPH|nr:hypothetical protein [Labrys wisconsinensis]MDQ0467642.1 DNA-binding helix-hairpin-helix protein with protein kinase domain [Labrys wisconsinensis]